MTHKVERGIPLRKKLRALFIKVQRNSHYRKWFGALLLRNMVFNWTRAGEDYCLSVVKNDLVVGSLYLSYVHDEYREGWLITGLRINRLYRHIGIGRQLLIHVSDFACRHAPCKIYADVLTEYNDLIKFYQSSGFSVDSFLYTRDQNIDLTPLSKIIPPASRGNL